MENKVVARFRDGRVVKGTTSNFLPTKPAFHLQTADRQIIEVKLADLKALFFVKKLEGDRSYHERKGFTDAKMYGQKVTCRLADGEILTGFTQGYDAKRPGFFLIPADPKSNNERVFVINSPDIQVNVLR